MCRNAGIRCVGDVEAAVSGPGTRIGAHGRVMFGVCFIPEGIITLPTGGAAACGGMANAGTPPRRPRSSSWVEKRAAVCPRCVGQSTPEGEVAEWVALCSRPRWLEQHRRLLRFVARGSQVVG